MSSKGEGFKEVTRRAALKMVLKTSMCIVMRMSPMSCIMYNRLCMLRKCDGWDMCPAELCTTSHVCVMVGICANVLHVQVMHVEEV